MLTDSLAGSDIELSWALVHEWLWVILPDPNSRQIRSINSLLHSDLWIETDDKTLRIEWMRRIYKEEVRPLF